jgi:uncharacterized membrane protein YccC
MTPEQIDTVTNGLINLHTFVDEYGPGRFAAAVAGACWMIASRIRARRAWRRQLRCERQQMARLAADIDAAPLIPTQSGRDNDLLAECNQILAATENRKEKPQP